MKIAWLFNLDADEELERPIGYTPSVAMQSRTRDLVQQLTRFTRPGDVILSESELEMLGAEYLGQAWSPTPRALAILEESGVRVLSSPSLETLQLVNHRAFCASMNSTLVGATFVISATALWEHMNAHAAQNWLLKRPFGFSGRGQMKLALPEPGESCLQWIEASFNRCHGLQVEPLVNIVREFAQHGFLQPNGQTQLGAPTQQVITRQGRWLRSEAASATDFAAGEQTALQSSVRQVAKALVRADYFGPFGVDAYRWRDELGGLHFNCRGEINARYSMGWPAGMKGWRPKLY